MNPAPCFEENLISFFGDTGQAIKVPQQSRYKRENAQLPDAYIGSNAKLDEFLVQHILQEDMWPSQVALPILHTESDLQIKWSIVQFDQHVLDYVPEEGVSRLVEHRTSERQDYYVRYGIGMKLEHGFMNTARGHEHFQANLEQIKNATMETIYYGVLDAYLRTKPFNKMLASTNTYYRSGNSMHQLRKDLEENDLGRWAVVQKSEHGFDLLHHHVLNRMRQVGVSPDMWILPPGLMLYLNAVLPQNHAYFMKGAHGPEEYERAVNREVTTFRKCMVFEAKPLLDPNQCEVPLNLLTRQRSIGEYNTMLPHIRIREDTPYRTEQRDLLLFNEDADQFSLVRLEDALDACPHWLDDLTEGGRMRPSEGNDPFLGKSYFADLDDMALPMEAVQDWVTGVRSRLGVDSKQVEEDLREGIELAKTLSGFNCGQSVGEAYLETFRKFKNHRPSDFLAKLIEANPVTQDTNSFVPFGYGSYEGMLSLAEDRWEAYPVVVRYWKIAKKFIHALHLVVRELQNVCPQSLVLDPNSAQETVYRNTSAAAVFDNILVDRTPLGAGAAHLKGSTTTWYKIQNNLDPDLTATDCAMMRTNLSILEMLDANCGRLVAVIQKRIANYITSVINETETVHFNHMEMSIPNFIQGSVSRYFTKSGDVGDPSYTAEVAKRMLLHLNLLLSKGSPIEGNTLGTILLFDAIRVCPINDINKSETDPTSFCNIVHNSLKAMRTKVLSVGSSVVFEATHADLEYTNSVVLLEKAANPDEELADDSSRWLLSPFVFAAEFVSTRDYIKLHYDHLPVRNSVTQVAVVGARGQWNEFNEEEDEAEPSPNKRPRLLETDLFLPNLSKDGYRRMKELCLEAQTNRDPLQNLLHAALLGTPTTRKALRVFLQKDTPFPFSFLLFRPFMTYDMASAILAKSGRETGETLVGHHDFQLADDIITKTHWGNFTCYLKSIVYKPQNVYIAENIFSTGYVGGNNVTFFRSNEEVDKFHEGVTTASMFSMLVPYKRRTEYSLAVSVTGMLPPHYAPFDPASRTNQTKQYETAEFYKRYWNFQDESLEDLAEDFFAQPSRNITCFHGHQSMYNPKSRQNDLVRENSGHWGRSVYAGCGQVRRGVNLRLRDIKHDNVIGGTSSVASTTISFD